MDELFFQMKLVETAKGLGVEVKVAATPDALQGLLTPAPKLLIVDLNSRNEPIATIQRLRADKNGVRVVGFLSPGPTDLAAQARAAGCDEVMPRSAFTPNLATLPAAATD